MGIAINRRLDFLQIDTHTTHNIETFRPTLRDNLSRIIASFYGYMRSHAETKRFFTNADKVEWLKEVQRSHWLLLFACTFDEAYVTSAERIGLAHLRGGVPPNLYIGGYTYFLNALQTLAIEHTLSTSDLVAINTAISKLVHLDMDIALSVYTREFYRAQAARGSAKG